MFRSRWCKNGNGSVDERCCGRWINRAESVGVDHPSAVGLRLGCSWRAFPIGWYQKILDDSSRPVTQIARRSEATTITSQQKSPRKFEVPFKLLACPDIPTRRIRAVVR